MPVLFIDSEDEDSMRLSLSSKGKVIGNVLADVHAIRYIRKFGKGAIPRDMVAEVCIDSHSAGGFSVEFYTKCDDAWNNRLQKRHPIWYRLGLVQKSKKGKFLLGNFECQVQAERFRELLEKLGYPMSCSKGSE